MRVLILYRCNKEPRLQFWATVSAALHNDRGSARTRAYGGKEIPTSLQSHALHSLLTCSYAELLQSLKLLSSQHLQLCLSNQLFKSDLNSTRHSFEKYMFFPRKKASQSLAATGPDQYCQAVIKM